MTTTSRSLPGSGLAFCAGFFFAGRSIFVLVSAQWLNRGTEPGVLAAFVLAALLGFAAAFCSFGAAGPFISLRQSGRPLQWVFCYLAFSGCSLFWTASASVSSSALYWLALAGDVAIVALLARAVGPEPAVHALLKGFIACSCLLAAVAWLMPAAADLRLGDLDYFNTNQIGNLCALALLMCSLLASRADAVWRGFPWFLGLTLARSLSKSTVIAFSVCLLYRLIRDTSMTRARKVFLVAAAALLPLAFWGLLGAYYDIYTTAGNQAETLTGRTAIWAWTLDAALSRPWFGNGFDGMWKVAPPFGGELFEARHAENELLQQFFAYGVCGVAFLLGIYTSLYRRMRAIAREAERSTLIAFLVFVLIRGLAEAEPFDLLLPLWLVTAFALLLAQPSLAQPVPSAGQAVPVEPLRAC